MDNLNELLTSRDCRYQDKKAPHSVLIWQVLGECEYPFRWGLDNFTEKPFTIIEDRFCHYSWEHFLAPFLWRITWAFESARKGDMVGSVSHLRLSQKLLEVDAEMNSKRSQRIGKSMQHILLATAAHLFARDNYYTHALTCINELKKITVMTPKERAAIFGMKAIILSKYGEDGQVQALEPIVSALNIVPEEVEWRFVCLELICALYEKNLGATVIKAATNHMHYEIRETTPEGEKVNINSFSQYYRNTWEQRDLAEAADIAKRTLDAAKQAIEVPMLVNPTWLENLHKDILSALETDPHSYLLMTATKFYKAFDVHKALAVTSIGKKLFRFCAESWVEMWSLLYPLEDYDLDGILRYYTKDWSAPIVKKASICFVNQQPKRAFTLALKVLQEQKKQWTYIEQLCKLPYPKEPPLFLWKNEISEGFYDAMYCIALTMKNNPAAKSYLEFYRQIFKPPLPLGRINQELNQSLKEIFSENKYFKEPISKDIYRNAPKELIFLG